MQLTGACVVKGSDRFVRPRGSSYVLHHAADEWVAGS